MRLSRLLAAAERLDHYRPGCSSLGSQKIAGSLFLGVLVLPHGARHALH